MVCLRLRRFSARHNGVAHMTLLDTIMTHKRPAAVHRDRPSAAPGLRRAGLTRFTSGLYGYAALTVASAVLTWGLVSVRLAFVASAGPTAASTMIDVPGTSDGAVGATASDTRGRLAN